MTVPSLRICSKCGRSWRPRNTKTRKGKCDDCGETAKNQIYNGEFAVPWRMPHRDDPEAARLARVAAREAEEKTPK